MALMKNQEFYYFSFACKKLHFVLISYSFRLFFYFSINLRTCFCLTNSSHLYQVFPNFYSPAPLILVQYLFFSLDVWVKYIPWFSVLLDLHTSPKNVQRRSYRYPTHSGNQRRQKSSSWWRLLRDKCPFKLLDTSFRYTKTNLTSFSILLTHCCF